MQTMPIRTIRSARPDEQRVEIVANGREGIS